MRAQFAVTVAFGLLSALLAPFLGPPPCVFRSARPSSRRPSPPRATPPACSRERAFELIASGREDLPLAAVACERSRLRDRRYRRRIARTLDVITRNRRGASGGRRSPPTRWR